MQEGAVRRLLGCILLPSPIYSLARFGNLVVV